MIGINIRRYGLLRKASYLVLTFFILLGLNSCNTFFGSDNKEVLNNTTPESSINDSIFATLQKELYENPSLARKHSNAILDTLNTYDPISKTKLLKYIGSSYVFETNYPEAIKYYNQALSIAEEIDLFLEIGNLNNNLGTILNESGSYTSAYIHFTAALDNYDLAGTPDNKRGTLNNIGLTYLNLNNNKKALSYFELALDSLLKPKNPILVASVLNNIALCYNFQNKPARALEYLNQSISLSKRIDNKYGLCISYKIKGDIYQNSQQYEKAFEAYTQSAEIAEKASLFFQFAEAKIGLGRVFLNTNRTSEALAMALDVINMTEDKNNLLLQTNAHLLLSEVYLKKKEFRLSLEHFKKHVELDEEINNTTIVNQIYDVELKHLDQLNKMQQLEIDKKVLTISKKNTLLFFFSLVLILLMIGFYLAYRNHHHKQETKLRETIIELNKKKSHTALEAEIRERARIGQNLHDSLGYLLSLAGLNASVLQKRKDMTEEKRKELLESLMESLDEAFNEVRDISHNLAPSLLSARGLKGALKNISTRVNQSTKLRMCYDTFNLDEKLDDLIENVLYRTLQEIVNNTIKHADASKLFIQIAKDEREITLMAEDNGKGFDYESLQEQSSLGLSHITLGIENLNGTIFIDSKIGRGTIISIVVPL